MLCPRSDRLPVTLVLTLLVACENSPTAASARAQQPPDEDLPIAGQDMDLRGRVLTNSSAYIPPQCYANTRGKEGRIHNPCFACHHDARRPNFVGDGAVQEAYDLPDPALRNPWTNLQIDRRPALAKLDAEALLTYVRRSNYFAEGGGLTLPARLADLPTGWDADGDGSWDGYVPDAWFDFDEQGFDHDPEGALTGWRSYAFRPFPGAFWPTNGGSAGDAMIRLPELFRTDSVGHPNLEVYRINLAILEAAIRREDVSIPLTSELELGSDLDGDGQLATADHVHYRWAPLHGETMRWAGSAGLAQDRGELPFAAGLFPRGTEFLHSVRYLDLRDLEDGARDVVMAARMKELRYARKRSWLSYSALDEAVADEAKERLDFPARVREPIGDVERGVDNGMGWVYQGFIEDARGELRPQTLEESMFCVGCHSGVGATDDGIFSFARKLGPEAPAAGWFHTAALGEQPFPDHRRGDGQGEYATYLRESGGDDFRSNTELAAQLFTAEGELRPEARERLARDLRPLLWPSPERALALAAAYRIIVAEQSYIRGRDASLAPPAALHTELDPAAPTGIEVPIRGPRDRRLP